MAGVAAKMAQACKGSFDYESMLRELAVQHACLAKCAEQIVCR